MAFTTWAAELARYKDAISQTPKERLLQSGYTDGQGHTVNYKTFQDISNYEKFLERQAQRESNSGNRRTITFAVGYGERR